MGHIAVLLNSYVELTNLITLSCYTLTMRHIVIHMLQKECHFLFNFIDI